MPRPKGAVLRLLCLLCLLCLLRLAMPPMPHYASLASLRSYGLRPSRACAGSQEQRRLVPYTHARIRPAEFEATLKGRGAEMAGEQSVCE